MGQTERRDNLLVNMIAKREPLTQLNYRKARDLPVEDDPVVDDELNIDQRSYAIGDSPLLSFAKAATIVTGMLLAGYIGTLLNAPQQAPLRPTPAASQDHDTQYELRLID